MKVSSIKCNKEKRIKEKGGGSREDGGAFMSNTDYQRIEN